MVLKLLRKRQMCLADTRGGKQPAASGSTGCQPGLFSSTQLPAAALCEALTPQPACSEIFSWHIHTSLILLNCDYFKWQLLCGTFCSVLKTCCCGVYTNVLMCEATWRQITRNGGIMDNWRQKERWFFVQVDWYCTENFSVSAQAVGADRSGTQITLCMLYLPWHCLCHQAIHGHSHSGQAASTNQFSVKLLKDLV